MCARGIEMQVFGYCSYNFANMAYVVQSSGSSSSRYFVVGIDIAYPHEVFNRSYHISIESLCLNEGFFKQSPSGLCLKVFKVWDVSSTPTCIIRLHRRYKLLGMFHQKQRQIFQCFTGG